MTENTSKTPRNIAKKTHEMLISLSQRDQLTGLLNRRGLVSTATTVLKAIKREKKDFSVAVTILDMIGLKALNIKYDEPFVDIMVADSAKRIESSVRGSDLTGRLREGGDEFVILSIDTDSTGVRKMLEKVRGAQTEEIKFNAVYKRFGSGLDIDRAIDDVLKNVDRVKRGLPKDQTGRVIGDGVTVELT